jgi:hypothetical protein
VCLLDVSSHAFCRADNSACCSEAGTCCVLVLEVLCTVRWLGFGREGVESAQKSGWRWFGSAG